MKFCSFYEAYSKYSRLYKSHLELYFLFGLEPSKQSQGLGKQQAPERKGLGFYHEFGKKFAVIFKELKCFRKKYRLDEYKKFPFHKHKGKSRAQISRLKKEFIKENNEHTFKMEKKYSCTLEIDPRVQKIKQQIDSVTLRFESSGLMSQILQQQLVKLLGKDYIDVQRFGARAHGVEAQALSPPASVAKGPSSFTFDLNLEAEFEAEDLADLFAEMPDSDQGAALKSNSSRPR